MRSESSPKSSPDEDAIIQNATECFEQMRSGDFETIYNALPGGVKKQTESAQTIRDSWDEAVTKAGGLPEDSRLEVFSYRPEHTEQIRVEFVIPCEKEDFKVFINYDSSGNLYNYVVWKNS